MNAVLLVPAVLRAVDPSKVQPGWLALVIVLLMCAATYVLWRSMNRQLKKVHFDDEPTTSADGKQTSKQTSEQADDTDQGPA
jgi:ABC-type nickel/cobalt efflux system permease component RcnA